MRDEMTTDNNFLLKGFIIVTSAALSNSFLHNLHEEHVDITKCSLIAGSFILWSGIHMDIKYYIKQCPKCIKLLSTLSADPLKTMLFSKVPGKIAAQNLWTQIKMLPSHHRSFLQIPLPIANVIYHHSCCHQLPDRVVCPQRNTLSIFTDCLNSKEWHIFTENMDSYIPLQACTTIRPMVTLKGIKSVLNKVKSSWIPMSQVLMKLQQT